MALPNIEDTYPLAPLQEGMLFDTLYASELQVYVEQLSAVLRGPLQAEDFQWAWQQVMDRHAILRTAFAWKNLDRPVQVVGRHVAVLLERRDWRELPPAQQGAQLQAHLDADRRRGFQLSKAPLMRLALFQTAADSHYFVWSFHHLLLDGWSVALVLQEVLAFYEACRAGRQLDLERPRRYRDYIGWLQRQDLQRAERFWRERLRGITFPTSLPMRRSARVALEPALRYAEEGLELSAELTARLRLLARKSRLTLNTVVQGAWALLLARYSGERDVIFGTTVSGRSPELPGVEAMVGMFINTLPVRVHLAASTPLVPWLQQLQTQQVECEQYAYSPLVDIHGWSEVPRGIALIESLVAFENYPVDASLTEQRAGIHLETVHALERTKYPLTLVAAAPHGELALKIFYDAACFEAAAVRRLLRHLQAVLTSMAADPEQRLGTLSIATGVEWQRLVVDWNATATAYASHDSIHELIELQALRAPDAVAVTCGAASLTYGALQARANQLAHHLRSLGVGPDVRVGICIERSLDLAVGLLGVLKAGGAYLPLDPDYPPTRLAFMVDDAQPRVLLTQQCWRARLPEHDTVLCLDSDWPSIARESPAPPRNVTRPLDLAYVIYTSGSTGAPKGVAVTHGNVINHALSQIRNFALCPPDRVLQFASLSFDAAVEEIFPTWASGAALVLRPAGPPMTGQQFQDFIERQRISVLNLPTAYWHEWVHAAARSGTPLPGDLRLVVVGGEKAAAQSLAEWQRALAPDITWINTYGPTEATVVTLFHERKTRTALLDALEIPLGRPLANTQAYVLDTQLNPVPIGAAGELYIGGAGLARGYLNRAGLTAERFVPHPFVPGERVYRSGDLVRWSVHGELEFIGRTDHQVKLRGYRIELGEIQCALGAHAGVSQAVVTAHTDAAGEQCLVGYVVVAPADAPTDAQLREHLHARLPAYMMPAVLMRLDKLPLTPNGKVDRKALPDPTDRPGQAQYQAPRTELEQTLSRIWAEVLRVPRVGVQDNFFELGGHSLKSIRLSQRLHAELGREVPLHVLFSSPTVHDMARWVVEQTQGATPYRIPLRAAPGAIRLVAFMPTILGSGVHYSRLVQQLPGDSAMLTCRIPGTMPTEARLTSIEALAAHCKQQLIVRGEFKEWSLVGWSFGGVLAYEVARQMLDEGLPIRRLVLIDAFLPSAPASASDALREQAMPRDFQRVLELQGAHPAECLNIYQANAAALHTYQPKACSLPVTEIRAAQPPHALDHASHAGRRVGSLSDRCSIVTVPGDHYSIFSAQHLADLAHAVNAALQSEEPRVAAGAR